MGILLSSPPRTSLSSSVERPVLLLCSGVAAQGVVLDILKRSGHSLEPSRSGVLFLRLGKDGQQGSEGQRADVRGPQRGRGTLLSPDPHTLCLRLEPVNQSPHHFGTASDLGHMHPLSWTEQPKPEPPLDGLPSESHRSPSGMGKVLAGCLWTVLLRATSHVPCQLCPWL